MQNDPNQQQPYQQPPQGYYPPQPVPTKKGGVMKWVALGCGGLLLAGVIIAVVVIVSAANAVSKATVSGSTTTSGSSSQSGQIAKVGQTITINGVQATLKSVKTHGGTDTDTPKSGNEYVVVEVTIHNTTTSEQSYSPVDFHVKSGSGDITNEEFVGFASNNQLSSGTLAAGGTTQGEMVFQAPVGDHKAELTWQPNFLLQGAGEYGWKLGL